MDEKPPSVPPPRPPVFTPAPPPAPPAPPPPPPPQQQVAATGPQPGSPSYYTPYSYPPPYYVYPYTTPTPARPLEPRQLRTVQALDTSVFTCYLLGAAFAWSALVALISVAALIPTFSGDPRLAPAERAWLDGVMIARVIVWLMFALAAILALTTFLKFHEGRTEFGPNHERRYRDLQASTALFGALVGGSGLLTFILSNGPSGSNNPQDQVAQLAALKSSIRLSALVWGATCAVAGYMLSSSFVRIVRPFVAEDRRKPLQIVPLTCLAVPLLHATFAIAFVEFADVATGTWTQNALRAVGEGGGLAGLLATLPLILLIRALREGQDRVLSGEIKPESARRTT